MQKTIAVETLCVVNTLITAVFEWLGRKIWRFCWERNCILDKISSLKNDEQQMLLASFIGFRDRQFKTQTIG